MRLYIPCTTRMARRFIDHGFTATFCGAVVDDHGEPTGEWYECVEFRDRPPVGLALGRTAEVEVTADDDSMKVVVGGGPVMVDGPLDFVLSIEVPDDIALSYEARDEEPMGWPFRDIWLPPDVANSYRDSLAAFDVDGDEVRLDLVGR